MKSKAINLKVDETLIARIDKLMPLVENDPTLANFGRISQSSIVRLAIIRGVELLEEHYKDKNLTAARR